MTSMSSGHLVHFGIWNRGWRWGVCRSNAVIPTGVLERGKLIGNMLRELLMLGGVEGRVLEKWWRT